MTATLLRTASHGWTYRTELDKLPSLVWSYISAVIAILTIIIFSQLVQSELYRHLNNAENLCVDSHQGLMVNCIQLFFRTEWVLVRVVIERLILLKLVQLQVGERSFVTEDI